MWQDATAEIYPRTLAFVSSEIHEIDGTPTKISSVPKGSGFAISTDPVLVVTNEHVITDEDGDILDDLRVGPFGGDADFRPAIQAVWSDTIDLAVVQVPGTVTDHPVTMWAGDPLQSGAPVASLGFPRPRSFWTGDDEDRDYFWQISRRLSTGHVSQADYPLRSRDGDRFPVPVYEMNLHIYAGNSGGPCFDPEGRVVGVIRSSLRSATETLGFSHAIRSDHVIRALDSLDASYEAAT